MGNERLNSAFVSLKISVAVGSSSIDDDWVVVEDDSFGFWICFSVVIGRYKWSKYNQLVFDEGLWSSDTEEEEMVFGLHMLIEKQTEEASTLFFFFFFL